jgi:hypothetical protein
MSPSPRALLIAVAALVGMALGAGPAGAHEFHAEGSPTLLQAEEIGTHVFENTSNESKIVCGEALLQGTTEATQTSEIDLAAYYAECTFGKTVAFVTMNGCEYTFYGETNGSGHAELKLDCPAGKQLEIKVGTSCTAKLSPRTYWGVAYANEGSGASRDFRLTLTVGGVEYEKVGLLCGTIFGNGKDMQLTGTWTVKGYQDFGGAPGSQRGIWVS